MILRLVMRCTVRILGLYCIKRRCDFVVLLHNALLRFRFYYAVRQCALANFSHKGWHPKGMARVLSCHCEPLLGDRSREQLTSPFADINMESDQIYRLNCWYRRIQGAIDYPP